MTRPYIKRKPLKNWPQERIDAARELRTQGMQAHKIAEALGGISTRQVQRMLKQWGVPYVKPVRVPKPKPKPRPKLRVIENTEPLAIGPINDFSEPGTCRWIHGDPVYGDWQCCGNVAAPEKSYCEHHVARCITKIKPKPQAGFSFRPLCKPLRGAT